MTPERWKRIEALYHAADATPPDERARFLTDACVDDHDLRREIETLLADSGVEEDFLSGCVLPVPSASDDVVAEPMAGLALGDYRLETLLGAGGMGQVYRAHDTRLGRDVAIKVLPPEFTSDPDRLARLEREARMLAALNHPNICGIYGLETVGQTRFLVLELVEGETLAAVLAAGIALPVHEALAIARQIAEALEVTHERGVIHRDLKPSNVTITPAGLVKVLDFGLAKPVTTSGPASDLTDARLATRNHTRPPGMMGTAAYMSPEQTRGLAVDTRTDIWAFGVVLFEVLVGKRPFRGDTTTDTLASILKTEPDWGELPPEIAPDLRRLLHRCLQKDPKRRLQSIADARVQIEDLLRGVDADLIAGEGARASRSDRFTPLRRHQALAWATAAIAVLATLIGISLFRTRDQPAFFFPVLPPPGAALATEESPIVSPDGQRLAFVAYGTDGTQRLYVHRLGASAPPQPLANTEGASLPFWSPDSQAIGFFAQGSLRTVNTFTGGLRTLAPAGGARGGTWSRHDVIVYVPSPREGPFRISASVDEPPRRVPVAAGTSPGGWFPSFLPDGRHFLEFEPTVRQPANAGVWVVALDSGQRTRLIDAQSNALYANGHLLFWREGTVWAQAFDESALRLSGTPRRVADAVGLNPVTNQGLFSVSDTGTLAYFAGTVGQTELVWFNRSGTELGRPGAKGVISTIALSPDATRVVFDQADPRTATFDLWQLVFAVGAPDKLTFNPSHDIFPMWSPDGSRIVFTSVRERPPQLYVMDPHVAGGETRLFQSPLPVVPSGWSRDGKTLFYTRTDADTATGDVWSLSLDDKASAAIVSTTNDERYGVPSPDGRWLAYVSNESGTYEVNVRALKGPGVRRQVSVRGGSQPQWGRDTAELIYLAPDRTLMAVDFQSGRDAFGFGSPRPLFRTRTKSIEIQGTTRTYAVTADGQHFLVANATEEAKSASIGILLHWLSAVAR
jgi:serine/threonine protein kinase/Tol biopolymer transport system component